LNKVFHYSFFLFSALDLVLICYAPDSRYLAKPLIMLSLLSYICWEKRERLRHHKAFILALCFAWVGDILLLISSELFFLLGLLSFLFTQVLYAISFYEQRQIGIHRHWLSIILIWCFLIASLSYLLPAAGSLRPAMVIYSISISAMLLLAIMRWKVRGYYILIAGALLFILSDGMIALNKFSVVSYDLSFLLMLSYIAAQYLIVTGYMKSMV